MAMSVCTNAVCQCTFGAAPSNLNIIPSAKVMTVNLPMASIMDNKPMVNILPFGVCQSIANPQVAAATAAALGVLTPMPCIPATTAPWAPGSPTVMVANNPALTNSSKLMCNWGGVISINFPGQQTVNVP